MTIIHRPSSTPRAPATITTDTTHETSAPVQSPAVEAPRTSSPPAPTESPRITAVSPEAAQDAATARSLDDNRIGFLMHNRLSTDGAAAAAPSSTEASDPVTAAMDKVQDEGGGPREMVVAGAQADRGRVKVNSDASIEGRERLAEVFKEASDITVDDKTPFDSAGQPLLKGGKPPTLGPRSWCGIWATNIWQRAGLKCKWVPGTGICEPSGKKWPVDTISSHFSPAGQAALRKIKPGDVITINTTPDQYPPKPLPEGGTKPKDLNHHAIVTSTVYEVPGQAEVVTVPPSEAPRDGKVVGFNTMNGNMGADMQKPERGAIREGFVDLRNPPSAGSDSAGNTYHKRVTFHYSMDPPQKGPKKR